ncbi:DUF748 domain-containing protein [Ferribacterium limneticum]|uniref:DUF748 domain-containing protein n=1 Tax=Ferribacterium limneticum TaxID=76259 RepID=UPI001CFAB049|nr:DUF748 domain-containing protein [Ferribacterium limneticum]UCV27110.1 DUF748 domain-containing protein [Ferribacterium limneticum]UCV31027.1 DUF748 domain-containing protein [Ferribacterium limneticum]
MSRLSTALKSSRSMKLGKWLGIFLLLIGVLGFLAAPPLLKSILQKQLSQQLHREVSIEQIAINPYALTAKVNGLSIKAEAGKEVAGFDELFINLSSASLFKLAAVVDEIRLQGLRLAVTRVAEGRYDISDLLDEWMKPKDEPEKPTPRFSLNNIQLINAKVVFDDQPKGKVHTISDINLAVPFVSSLPYQAEVLIQPSFSANINGSPLALTGDSKPFSTTHESQLNLDLDRFDLAVLQPYLPESLPFRLNAGTLDTEIKAMFKEVSDKVYSVTIVGAAHVSTLAVAESDGQPLVGWKRLDVELDSVDPLNRKAAVKRVALDGLDVSLAVNKQGEFNVLRLLDKLAKPGAAEPAAKPESAKPFEWTLGEFALSNGLLRWKDESNPVPVDGEVRNLLVSVGKVDGKLVEPIEINEVSYQVDLGERFRVEKMAVKGIRLDLPAHRVDIAEVTNTGARARMLRNKAGKIEWVSSPVLKTIRATDAKAKDEKPWIGKVGKLAVEDLGFRFEDQSLQPVAVQEIDGFNLHGEGLTNEPNQKGTIALKSRINKKGSLNVDGSLQVFPLDVAVKVDTVAVPLMPLEPYLGQFLNISLTRGMVSNKGEATAKLDTGGLKAGYKGSFTLGDFVAVDKLNSADFVKWKSLYFGGIDFRLEPMAINIGEIALTDFYSRLILNKEGRLNVADIVKKSEGETVVAKGESKPAESKLEAKVASKETGPAKPPVPIKIGKITLQNGTVNFSDFFVKPNYTVNLTKLGGRISGLSSAADTVADMDVRGKYANSAPVQILAKLNPLAAKSFLDLKADITGVDLTGFSPYSGKYAGYAIEKGKLSLSVAYKLENNQLAAENRLFIDQFTFGEKIDSPDATKLPVNLAISLLKNNRGEIDLNLPIAGSLDDPQFSIGGLIIKVIVNLFVKAVTSPFALLGSMFGSGEELSNVEFAVGRAGIDGAGTKKLENLAKALVERNSLKLEITGRADPETDKEGVKRVAIERAMKAEKLKDLKKAGEGMSLEDIEIAPEETKTYLTRAYKEAKFPKPRNMVGLQKELPVEEMEKLMLANFPASDDDIKALATRRAEAVQGWLVEQGKVPPERVFLLPPKVERDDKGKGSRADFSLR